MTLAVRLVGPAKPISSCQNQFVFITARKNAELIFGEKFIGMAKQIMEWLGKGTDRFCQRLGINGVNHSYNPTIIAVDAKFLNNSGLQIAKDITELAQKNFPYPVYVVIDFRSFDYIKRTVENRIIDLERELLIHQMAQQYAAIFVIAFDSERPEERFIRVYYKEGTLYKSLKRTPVDKECWY